MKTIDLPAALSQWSRAVRDRGETIAFVPTMGFLHAGHLSLMREARTRGQHLVASIFVNPLQFGLNEDLDLYPRDAVGDAASCRAEGVDVLFTPTRASLYPDGFQTTLKLGSLAGPLCGASRPGHFEGMATVVLKLFNLVRPTTAVFGNKDFQQLAIIRQMVRDLDLDVDIVGGPTVREPDGVAMSSRNANLDEAQRLQARALSGALDLAEELVEAGERGVEAIIAAAADLITEQPLASIDYVELVDADSLQVICDLERPGVMALAVRFGGTRLIDNRVLVP